MYRIRTDYKIFSKHIKLWTKWVFFFFFFFMFVIAVFYQSRGVSDRYGLKIVMIYVIITEARLVIERV